MICTEGNEDYNAIDADVGVTTDGTPWLSFGSFWGGLYSFELNQDGSRRDNNLTHLAWASQIEAPVLGPLGRPTIFDNRRCLCVVFW